MRLRASLLVASGLVLALAVPATAQAPAAAPAPGAPKARVESPEFDAGAVARGQEIQAVFTLHNDGDADLRILSAKPG